MMMLSMCFCLYRSRLLVLRYKHVFKRRGYNTDVISIAVLFKRGERLNIRLISDINVLLLGHESGTEPSLVRKRQTWR